MDSFLTFCLPVAQNSYYFDIRNRPFFCQKTPLCYNKKMAEKSKIKSIKAREISDSNGKPTVEVELKTNFGKFRSSVPSGVSTGKYEAAVLETKKAIENIEKIIFPAVKEYSFFSTLRFARVIEKEDLSSQKKVDEFLIQLDGTKNKSRLGANAILPVSMAVCRAAAARQKLPLYRYISRLAECNPLINLPKPSFNMVEGGKHAESGLAFQEFMIVPQKETFKENFRIGKEIYNSLKKILEEKFGKKNVGLSKEGAFTAPIEKITDAFDLILEAAGKTGHKENIKFAIDAAASEFYEDGNYKVDGKTISREQLSEFYKDLTEKYPIILIEDPFHEEDFGGFAELKNEIGERALIFGDDLTVSNIERIKLAKENNSCSGLILKPNQIGTVSETIEAAKLAKSFTRAKRRVGDEGKLGRRQTSATGWKIMVANRAGETKDDFIADLAVGVGAEFIKSGAPFPKERMVKYNRLVKIEEELHA